MEKRIIFTLISNKAVAKRVAKLLNAELGEVSFDYFADGEVLVKTLSDVVDKDVILIESTAKKAQARLFELLLLIDSIKRSGAKSLKLYIPYFGYSRQERVSWYNEPVSCEVVAKILDTAKVDAIYTLDIHHDIIQNFFQTPFYNVMTTSLFANYYKKLFKDKKVDYKDVVIVSPDHGSNIRSEALCKELPGSKLVILTKYRPKPNLAEHLQVKYEEVKDKHCVIIDDIIDTGGTIISASNLLMENDAKAVYVAGSHAVFSNRAAENLLNAPIEDIVVTNSIEKRLPNKIKVLDISSLIK